MKDERTSGDAAQVVVAKAELVVIDRTNLPNMGDLILDCQWSEGAKFFIRAKVNPYEETDEEISRALYEMASHCQDMGLENEKIYVALEWLASKWGISSDGDELTTVISMVRQKTSGAQIARLIDP